MIRAGLALALVIFAGAGFAVWQIGPDPDMAQIAAGPAILGGTETLGLQGPKAYQVAAFEIDVFEVTNQQFSAFVAETDADPSAFFDVDELNAPDQPVTGVLWSQAQAYCHWSGKRLPTEIEWEKAARGADGQAFPWAGEYDEALAHLAGEEPVLVQALATDLSPYGVRGMAGNVAEWVADTRIAEAGVCGAGHDHETGEARPEDPTMAYLARLAALDGNTLDICRNPEISAELNPVEPCAFIKGNSFAGLPHMTRLDNRMWDYTNTYADFVGFRCARDLG